MIPKPSRAGYPCMRASFPILSGFVGYLLALVGAAASVGHAHRLRLLRGPSALAVGALVAVSVWTVGFVPRCGSSDVDDTTLAGDDAGLYGKGIGTIPGRVVWVHDPRATNESATNVPGDGYFLAKNNDQAVIDRMFLDGVKTLTGQEHGERGLRRALPLPQPTAWQGVSRLQTRREGVHQDQRHQLLGLWHLVGQCDHRLRDRRQRLLRHLGDVASGCDLELFASSPGTAACPESSIVVGDPLKEIYNHVLDQWSVDFPGVTYIGKHGGGGRTAAVAGSRPTLFYSDRGAVLRAGTSDEPANGAAVTEDRLYGIYEDAEYVINVPALKAHARAGVTLAAKNHFGSQTRDDAQHLHMGLVDPAGAPVPNRPNRQGYGLYRIQVDLMGHRLLGGKTMLYLIDGLWAGSEAVDPPVKFQTAPFNDDWTSSLLLSQDPVAVESVGYDILKSEFTEARHPGRAYPQMVGVDDYLHQAADPSKWARGVTYDPENDGSPLTSLGVHEHWQSPTDRRYSRNLGQAEGIDLVYADVLRRASGGYLAARRRSFI